MKWTMLISMALLGLSFAGCTLKKSIPVNTSNMNGENTMIANPASVYCKQNGGQLSIVADKDGGQSGLCVFDDGSSCDEWTFYRHECDKGQSLSRHEWKF